MSTTESRELELLSDLDALLGKINEWGNAAVNWETAIPIREKVRGLTQYLGAMRKRIEAPITLGVLGGTGVGKSALVNALAGAEVVKTGKERPTTGRPIMVSRPEWTPETYGIDPTTVDVVHRDLPALTDFVLIDCPDPDTTEAEDVPGTNLARLRQILPHCDVLLVVTTQQKYRSARVADELAAAAPGARLVFVQTHADVDGDIRDDWSSMIDVCHRPSRIFRVNSLTALADAQQGVEPRSEFAALVDFLKSQLAGKAAARIRRENLLDRVEHTLSDCRRVIDEAFPKIQELIAAIDKQRSILAERLRNQMVSDLKTNLSELKGRLLGKVLSRWRWSPFWGVLWVYHAMDALLVRVMLLRARTPAHMALWGAVEGVRSWQANRRRRRAEKSAAQAVARSWDETELRNAALVVEGFASEAGIDQNLARAETVLQEAAGAASSAAELLKKEVEAQLERVAKRYAGWWTQRCYDVLFSAVFVVLFFRLAKNYFYDSWLASPPSPLLGFEYYLISCFWLIIGAGLLLWRFTRRLQVGLESEIDLLAKPGMTPRLAENIFGRLESEVRAVEQFRQGLERLQQQVAELRRRVA